MKTKIKWQIVFSFAVVGVILLTSVTSIHAALINGTDTLYTPATGQIVFDWDRNSQYNLSFPDPSLQADQLIAGGILYEFTIPNFYDPLPLKTVEISIVGRNSGASGLELAHILDVFGSDSEYGVLGAPSVHVDGFFVSGSVSPMLVTETWEMYPNPDWEHVKIWAPDAFELESIHIVTQSVPIPAAIYLLGGGLVGLVGLRRKIKK